MASQGEEDNHDLDSQQPEDGLSSAELNLPKVPGRRESDAAADEESDEEVTEA